MKTLIFIGIIVAIAIVIAAIVSKSSHTNNQVKKYTKGFDKTIVKPIELEFNELKTGGMKAMKYINTSLGLIVLDIYNGAAYSDYDDRYFIEINHKLSKKQFHLSDVEMTELIVLIKLMERF